MSEILADLWQNQLEMSVPFGRPILVLMICSLVTGGGILFRSQPGHTAATVWVSVDSHARMYRKLAGNDVSVNLIAPAALDVRLLSMFMFGQSSASAPDAVELDLGSVGKFFRSPTGDVGFLPLNSYLEKSGWMARIVRSRFLPWSKGGVIFGVPDDLHPCTISYRKDLFDEAGVNLASATSWVDLQSSCLAFEKFWKEHGRPRVAMGLSSTGVDMLLVMLHQQRVQLVDADLAVHLTDEKVVRTLWWYAQAVAGERRFGSDLNPAPGQNARDLAEGDICSLITPDWMIGDLKEFGPEMKGKLAMMPLPRFGPGDANSASWGGTMVGIVRTCPDPDRAWKLIESLYLDRTALRARLETTGIIPPIPEYWGESVFHQSDEFFGGEKIMELYIQLARNLPENVMTPYTTAAQTFLTIALNKAVAEVRSRGNTELESHCLTWLSEAQTHVESMIRFDGRRTNQ